MRKRIALYSALAATAISLSAAAGVVVMTNNTNASNVLSDKKANIYKYVTFAKDTEATPRWTITGNNIVAVKPGKIFHTVEDRPVATADGYVFQYWSKTNNPFGTPEQMSETEAINADIKLYPVFKAIGVTKIEVLGETNIPQNETKFYQTYIEPSYAPIKTVDWAVYDDSTCQTVSTKASIKSSTTTGHEGEGELTPDTTKGTGDVWVKATAKDGSAVSGVLKVTIISVVATEVTVTKTAPTGSSAKVGETASFSAAVSPTGAAQKVNWIVTGDTSSGHTAGSAEITTETDTTLTITGVTEGWVAVSARANGTAVISQQVLFEFTKASVTAITITGPTRMDIKDTATFTSKVTPQGTEPGVTWHAYEADPTQGGTPEASTIAEFTGNELKVKQNVDLEDGSKYVYVRASSNETGSTVVSNVVALRVHDIMSFMYGFTDGNGKRWFYDPTTLETNNTSTKIVRYCYDDPSQTKVEAERANFNEPITVGKYITSIGDDFLANCTGFKSAITFEADHSTTPKHYLTDIGEGFMFGCGVFDQTLTLPESLTYIGADFMEGCKAFGTAAETGALTIPASVTFVGDYFMHNCTNFKTLVVNTPVANYSTVWQQSMDVLSVRDEPAEGYKISVTLVKAGGAAITAFRAIYADLDGTATTEGYKVWRTLDLKEAE